MEMIKISIVYIIILPKWNDMRDITDKAIKIAIKIKEILSILFLAKNSFIMIIL